MSGRTLGGNNPYSSATTGIENAANDINITTKDDSSSANICIQTGDSTTIGGTSGKVKIKTGDVSDSGDLPGPIEISPGEIPGTGGRRANILLFTNEAGTDWPLQINRFAGTTNGAVRGFHPGFETPWIGAGTNSVILKSGPVGFAGGPLPSNGDTGSLYLQTGEIDLGTHDTGDIFIETGNVDDAGATPGGITLKTGRGPTNVKGGIEIDAEFIFMFERNAAPGSGEKILLMDEFVSTVNSSARGAHAGMTTLEFSDEGSRGLVLSTGDAASFSSGNLYLQTGATSTSSFESGEIFIETGDVSDNGDDPGRINIIAGKRPDTSTGRINLVADIVEIGPSLNPTITNNLAVGLYPDNTSTVTSVGIAPSSVADDLVVNTTETFGFGGDTGDLYLNSGSITSGAVGDTGDLLIRSGLNTVGGDSGNIELATGTVAGGTRGQLQFKDGTEGTVGHVWTSTAVDGKGAWAAAPGGGDLWSDPIDSNITLDSNETYELGTSSVHHEKIYTRKLDFSEGTSVKAQFFAEVSGFTTFSGTAATWLANSTARIASPNLPSTGNTQPVQLGTGNQTGTGLSGDIDIKTGDASGNDSGDITLETGSASATRGVVKIDALAVEAPRAAADPSTTVGGSVYYNTVSGKLRVYNDVAAAWQDLN